MLSILDFRRDGPLLHFAFGTGGLEEHDWEHTAVADPLASWVDGLLLPLARRERQGCLRAEDVLRCLTEQAAKDRIPLPAIDWLGLALYAAQCFREAAGGVASGSTARLQEDCRAADAVAVVLSDIYERIAQAVHATLRNVSSSTA